MPGMKPCGMLSSKSARKQINHYPEIFTQSETAAFQKMNQAGPGEKAILITILLQNHPNRHQQF